MPATGTAAAEPSAAPSSTAFGPALDRWLQHLDGAGFRVGVRERLLVQTLLARLAASGELPADLHGTLALAAPLLCGSREQQRHYATLLKDFVDAVLVGRSGKPQPGSEPEVDPARHWRWVVAAAAALLLVVAGLWWGGVFQPPVKPKPIPPVVTTPPVVPPDTPASSSAPAAQFIVPLAPLPLEPDRPPAWSGPARGAVVTLGALCAIALGAAAWARRQRRVAMAGVRTDEELDDHPLRDAAPVDIAPHPTLARAVGRALRQYVAGNAHALDLPATLRATIAAQGAFTPRWRQIRSTPEYVALVDTRHPDDHHAAAVHTLLEALVRAGVAIQVWAYDTTPAAGCWLHRGYGNHDALTRHRVPLAVLAARAAGQRLLVFGPADVLVHPVTGSLQAWAASLLTMPERVWITPQPVHAWGPPELAADAAGFLVLPLQEAALTTLAGWLTSRRLTLALDPDTPTSVPPMLAGGGIEWVTRGDAPPPDTVEQLVLELRTMLGGLRFQWLCGCAIFPALTPPLTLALGRQLLPDPRALALGLAALAALPWFRWGRMPDWLRRRLLDELAPDIRTQLAGEVHARLDHALLGSDGPMLADVATRKRRLFGALQQRRGPLRDVVLADFIREDVDPGLAQQLPEGLRRRLFRHGDAGEGLRPAVQAFGVLAVLGGLVALTPVWSRLAGTAAQPPLRLLDAPMARSAPSKLPVAPTELRAIGESLLLVPQADGLIDRFAFEPWRGAFGASLEMLDAALLRSVSQPLATTDASGRTLTVSNDGQLQLQGPGGTALGTPLVPPAADGRVRIAAFTPSGSRVVAVLDDGTLASWGAPWASALVAVVTCGSENPGTAIGNLVQRTLTADATVSKAEGRIGVVTYGVMAWQSMPAAQALSFAAPNAGEVRRSPGYDPAHASAVVQTLRDLQSRMPLPAWADPIEDPTLPGQTLVIGACVAGAPAQQPVDPVTPPLAIPGLDAAAAALVTQRVRALFDPDAPTRVAAAEALVKDPEHFSDAVSAALTLALQAQALRSPAVEPQLSGVVNTLVLLQSASPATLRRERSRIEQLVGLSSPNGEQTRSLGRGVQERLKAAMAQKPVVYLQIAGEYQRPLAEQLAKRLQANGLAPAGIEDIGRRAPARNEIRIQGNSDRPTARTLGDVSRAVVGGSTLFPLTKAVTNDTYEVWLDSDLCRTQMLDGCGVTATTPAASSAASTPYPGANTAPVVEQSSKGPASDALVDLVATFEGTSDGDPSTPNLDAFLDPSGSWTIGYGHRITVNGRPAARSDFPDRAAFKGEPLRIGSEEVPILDGITRGQARTLLRQDLQPFLAAVDSLVKVPLTTNQREALASFVYNAGPGGLRNSSILSELNAGNYEAVPDLLMSWRPKTGNFPGLQQRRAAEAAMWSGLPSPKVTSLK
jgi:GH24 family phage-related lysozyme (muramidase)